MTKTIWNFKGFPIAIVLAGLFFWLGALQTNAQSVNPQCIPRDGAGPFFCPPPIEEEHEEHDEIGHNEPADAHHGSHTDPGFGFVGTDACVQCHKDGHEFPTHANQGKEYSIWSNRDPHSCAFSVLFDERSEKIAENLELKIPPHKNDMCLNCHSTNAGEHEVSSHSHPELADGVGCESCHGAAGQWLVEHKLPGWQYLSDSEKDARGFVITDNIAQRARQCVQCHIGSPGRDVNHDLVAAGHPRLYFEMAAYQAKIPRHWSREKDLQINSVSTESRLWLIGQFVSAATSLDLLQQRAVNHDAAWPEFTEYGCFSCHHELAEQRWEEDGFFKNGLGKPAWGTWHFATLEKFLNGSGNSEFAQLGMQLGNLREQMQARLPDRATIAQLTSGMIASFNQIADRLSQTPISPADTAQIAAQLSSQPADPESLNWDELTQRYLAAVALRQTQMDANQQPQDFLAYTKNRLTEIRDTLKFIEKHDGPKDLSPDQRQQVYNSFAEVFGGLKN